MIDNKPPEEKKYVSFVTDFDKRVRDIEKVAIDENLTKELHELNKTLKDILKEMRRKV